MTISDQIAKGLEASGWHRDPQARSLTRRVFFKPGVPDKVYLGKNGSLRYGRNQAESFVVSDAAKAEYIRRGQQQ